MIRELFLAKESHAFGVYKAPHSPPPRFVSPERPIGLVQQDGLAIFWTV